MAQRTGHRYGAVWVLVKVSALLNVRLLQNRGRCDFAISWRIFVAALCLLLVALQHGVRGCSGYEVDLLLPDARRCCTVARKPWSRAVVDLQIPLRAANIP